MKKQVKILIGVIFILIVFIIIYIIYVNGKENYTNREIIETTIKSKSINENFTENNSIELEDLTVQLTKVNFSKEGNEYISSNNVLDFTLEFKSKNNLNINQIMFDYLIFDNNNKIINTSLWDHPKDTKKYIRGFVKEKYNKNQFYKFTNYFIWESKVLNDNITDNLKKVSKTMSSSLKEELYNPKQINLKIIDLKYQFEKSKYKTVPNTDLEFILSFE